MILIADSVWTNTDAISYCLATAKARASPSPSFDYRHVVLLSAQAYLDSMLRSRH